MKHKINARAVAKPFTSCRLFWRGIKPMENGKGKVFCDLMDYEHTVKRTGLSFQSCNH